MPVAKTMERTIAERYPGEAMDAVLVRLIERYKTPEKVAGELGVYRNAVRTWMTNNGYIYTPGEWKREIDHVAS